MGCLSDTPTYHPLVGGHPGQVSVRRERRPIGTFHPWYRWESWSSGGSPKDPARGACHVLGYVSLCVCVCGILAILVDNRVLPGVVCVGPGSIGINTADLVVEIRWFGETFG